MLNTHSSLPENALLQIEGPQLSVQSVPITTKFNHVHDEVYSIQHYVITFVSDLRHVGGFLRVLWFPPPIKTDYHDITEILLKVALNNINRTKPN